MHNWSNLSKILVCWPGILNKIKINTLVGIMFILLGALMFTGCGSPTNATPEPTRSVSGNITANGKPLYGVRISLYGAGQSYGAITDVNGNYNIPNAPVTTRFWVRPLKMGYSFADFDYFVEKSYNNVTVNFTGVVSDTQGTNVISGKVSDSNGTGIAGVTVNVDASYSATTDANGNYAVPKLYVEGYLVTPSKEGYTFNPTYILKDRGPYSGVNFIGNATTAPNTSSDATLSALTISAGTMSPTFSAATTAYSATIPYGTTSFTITPTVSSPGATVKINNVAVASGSASTALPLTDGVVSSYNVVVTAADNTTTKTYTVTRIIGIPTDHLVGTWLFNGNANDTSGNSHNGTVTSATLTTDRHGTSNAAYAFDGLSSKITVPNASDLLLNGTSFAISIWAKSTVNSQIEAGLLSNYQSASGFGYVMVVYGTPNILNIGTNGAVCSTSSTVMANNIWHNYVWSYNAATHTSTLFVDGTPVTISNSTLAQSPSATNTDPLVFGVDYGLGSSPRYWNGALDDIRIYNRALTIDEVTAINNN